MLIHVTRLTPPRLYAINTFAHRYSFDTAVTFLLHTVFSHAMSK